MLLKTLMRLSTMLGYLDYWQTKRCCSVTRTKFLLPICSRFLWTKKQRKNTYRLWKLFLFYLKKLTKVIRETPKEDNAVCASLFLFYLKKQTKVIWETLKEGNTVCALYYQQLFQNVKTICIRLFRELKGVLIEEENCIGKILPIHTLQL